MSGGTPADVVLLLCELNKDKPDLEKVSRLIVSKDVINYVPYPHTDFGKYGARNFYISSPLCVAISQHHNGIVLMLLKAGANVENRERGHRTTERPISVAIKCSNLTAFLLLINHNASIHYKEGDGFSPLEWAVTYGTDNGQNKEQPFETMKPFLDILIALGANVNEFLFEAREKVQQPLIFYALGLQATKPEWVYYDRCRFQFVQYLLEHGADPTLIAWPDCDPKYFTKSHSKNHLIRYPSLTMELARRGCAKILSVVLSYAHKKHLAKMRLMVRPDFVERGKLNRLPGDIIRHIIAGLAAPTFEELDWGHLIDLRATAYDNTTCFMVADDEETLEVLLGMVPVARRSQFLNLQNIEGETALNRHFNVMLAAEKVSTKANIVAAFLNTQCKIIKKLLLHGAKLSEDLAKVNGEETSVSLYVDKVKNHLLAQQIAPKIIALLDTILEKPQPNEETKTEGAPKRKRKKAAASEQDNPKLPRTEK